MMPDDYSADIETKGVVTVGGTVEGSVEAAGDRDWFAVEFEAGRTYTIDLRGSPTGDGTLSDPYLHGIYDENGNPIDGTLNDNGGTGNNSRVTFTASDAGTYYIVAGSISSHQGTYQLEVRDTTPPPDDFGATAATAGAIEVGGSVTGEIGAPRDFDWFALDAVAGHTYVIDLEGSETDAGTLANPQLRGLFGAGSGRLPGTTYDLDGGEGLNSRMTWTASETGTVYVAVRGHKDDTGTYTLSVTDTTPQDDFGDTAATAGAIEVGGSVTGEIGAPRDFDWFALDAVAGRTYVIDLEGSETDAGTLADPQVRGLFNAGGRRLPGTTNDRDGGEGLNSRMTWTAGETGTVYVAARGHKDDTGTYTLSVTDITPQAQEQEQEAANGSPVFGEASYAFELAENANGALFGIALGEVRATDPDGDAVTYSIVSGAAGRFAIDPETGALSYVGTGEDSESGVPSYELTVRASDGAAHSQVTVTVTVTDVEEEDLVASGQDGANRAPQFASTSYAFTLDENVAGVPLPVSLGLVGATDADGDAVTYSIVSGDAVRFAIDAATGALSYAGTGEDYESGTRSYDLTVRASDGAAHSDAAVTVFVGDVDEDEDEFAFSGQDGANRAPQFASPSYAFTLDENVAGVPLPVSLGLVGATDADGDAVTYSIVSGDAVRFVIDAATGALSYAGTGEDYESGTTSYDLTVRASDGAAHSDVTVTVFVGDVEEDEDEFAFSGQDGANRAPQFASPSYAFALDENVAGVPVPVSLGLVGATDADGDAVTYSIVSGDAVRFAIDAATGALSYAGTGEDYESGTTSYDLTVRASDGAAHSDAAVTVFVGDVEEDEEDLVSLGQNASVSEPGGRDLPANTTTTGAVAVGGSATGRINYADDRDWFAVTLEAGRTYLFDMKGEETGHGTLYDPNLYGVHDANGKLMPGTPAKEYDWQHDSQVAFTPEVDGTYYVVAGARHVQVGVHYIGTYALSVTDITNRAPDDFSATTSTSGAVTVGGSAQGEIDHFGDSDWFAVTLVAGKTYRIDLKGTPTGSGTLRDPYLLGIRDTDGNLIAGTRNDDGGADNNSRVFFMVEEDGVYYVMAGSNGHREGTYTLTVTETPDDYAAGTAASGTVAVGGSSTGEIDYRGDSDWFAVTLVAGKTYRIDLEGSPTDAGTLSDPHLRGIHDANGNLISGTANDNAGADRNSRVFFVAAADGTHYVAVGASGDKEGTYTLSVTEIVDDYTAGKDTSGTVTVGMSTTGEIQTPDDRDWFAVTLEANKTYRIDLEGRDTGGGTLTNPRLYGIHDADGDLISGTANGNGGAGSNSRVDFVATEAATYYVATGSDGDLTGTYTLSVTDITDGLPDDHTAGTDTSGTVTVGASATGRIDYEDDRDWFKVTLVAGKTYRIDLEGSPTGDGTLSDPYLHGIHDANGDLVAGTTNNDGGVGSNSIVFLTATADADHYVAAGAHGDKEGTYTLSVTEVADDYTAGTDTTGTVVVGGSATGTIEPPDDRDWFAVTLQAGKTYRIDLKGSLTGDGTLSDPYLRGIHDASGDFIAGTTNYDGEGGAGRNSIVHFTATADATYYVAAGAGRDTAGTYTLSVTEVADDYTAGTDTTGTVTVGGSATGKINYRLDRDWFAVTLEADTTYRIDLEGSRTGSGTLSDPYLRGIHDANGDLISGTTNDDGGTGRNSRVEFTATDDATYYVAAGAFWIRHGTYTLSVEEVM